MNKRQKIKKWFKDHFTKKNVLNWLFVGLIVLIVILCVYFENKDKETMKNKESNITILNDNIDLNKNILYGGVQITTTTNYNISYNQFDDYLKLNDFNYDGQAFSSGDVAIYITRFNLNTIKNNLLSYNNNSYSVDLSTTSLTIEFNYESYQSNQEYGVIYYQYNNNSNVNYKMALSPNTSLFARNLVDSNSTFRYSDRMQLDFNYDYLDFCYYIIYNDQSDELITGYQNYMYFNDNISFYSQQLQNENNALQERINNLSIQLDDALLGQDIKYNLGYQVGLNEGANQDLATNGFTALLNSIFSYPINFISSVFNFEFMGINVASILLFLVSICVVLFVVKRLWK